MWFFLQGLVVFKNRSKNEWVVCNYRQNAVNRGTLYIGLQHLTCATTFCICRRFWQMLPFLSQWHFSPLGNTWDKIPPPNLVCFQAGFQFPSVTGTSELLPPISHAHYVGRPHEGGGHFCWPLNALPRPHQSYLFHCHKRDNPVKGSDKQPWPLRNCSEGAACAHKRLSSLPRRFIWD